MDSTATYDRDALEKMLHDPTASPIGLPIQFLKDVTCNFSGEQEVGRGGYGVVYKGVLRCGKPIAVKKIFDIHLVEDDQFHREVSYLMSIKHKNIVQLVGYCAESRWIAIELPNGNHGMAELPTRLICFEYLCNEGLDNYISDESSGLDWYKRFEIIKGICSGLHFLHEKHIVHLDLKPKNILMDSSMMPKVADFGLSRLLGAEKSRTIINGNLVGSPGYMAPEYSFQGVISPKAHIFSFGVIIIEIITGFRNYPLINTVPYVQHQYHSRQSIEIYLQEYTDNVLGRWRNRFQKELHTSSDIYTQQVKECITIALKCVDCDSTRRPNACDIYQMLTALESTNCHAKDMKDSVLHQVQEEAGKHPTWKLAFQTPPQLPISTSSKIVGANGSPLEIILADAGTGSSAAFPPELPLEVVPLMGNFPLAGREHWAADEFQKNILVAPDGRSSLLMGDVGLTMRDGRATVGKLWFADNSSWVGCQCHTFRIGVRVVPGSFDGGTRVLEAITEAFVVTDHHVKLHRKRYHPPSLSDDDEVSRVVKVGKGVASNRNLEQQHVKTVQEFVRMVMDKPDELRAILSNYMMTEHMWEAVTMKHTKCHAEDSRRALVYQAGQMRSARCIQSLLEILPGERVACKLAFETPLQLPIFTGSKIEDAKGDPLEIILVDADSGSPVALPQVLHVELVALFGDFPPGDSEYWAAEEFQNGIVKPREGKRPLLTGHVRVTMVDGRATVGELQFTDNSHWVRCCKFRIGARVTPDSCYQGSRVQEAITEAFLVRDYRGELYRKHYPPVLGDEVWRLEKIGKGGLFQRKLADSHIHTVQDFVRMLMVKPQELRAILGDGMTDRMWEVTTGHARSCVLGDGVYVYKAPHGTIYVNSIFQLVKVELGGLECPWPLEQLNTAQKEQVHNLILEAYENRDSLQEVDGAMIHTNAAGNASLLHDATQMVVPAPADTTL